jgi:hypothetical protein
MRRQPTEACAKFGPAAYSTGTACVSHMYLGRQRLKCQSGKHEWTNPEDAAKCCNGWHRELRVGFSTNNGVAWYAHTWAPDQPEAIDVGRDPVHLERGCKPRD